MLVWFVEVDLRCFFLLASSRPAVIAKRIVARTASTFGEGLGNQESIDNSYPTFQESDNKSNANWMEKSDKDGRSRKGT